MAIHLRPRRWALLPLLIATSCVTGCSAGSAPSATPWPVPTASSDPASSRAVSIPMPDLGPSPAPVPLSDVDRETLRLANLDAQWQSVVSMFPDAKRPDVEFAAYLSEADRAEKLAPCYTESGIKYSEGTDENGTVVGLSPSIIDEASAVAIFLCDAAYPHQLVAPPSPEILGYLYDYFTKFVVPCYEANGITNNPAPTREAFITQWPNQNWFPSMGDVADTADGDAIETACPLPPR